MGNCISGSDGNKASAEAKSPNTTISNDKSFYAEFTTGKDLGEGAFSVVKECTEKSTGTHWAAKIVTLSKLTKEDKIALKDEVAILTELQHPSIVRLHRVFNEPSITYLVMENMRGGELFDRIVAKQFYTEKEARDCCYILFKALEYCHSCNVAHRDLKPENLLLISETDDSSIKIADFGFAKKAMSAKSLKTQCGTPNYVAPEVLEGVRYGTQADMWSIGVIFFILLGGYPPFSHDNHRELYRKIRKGEFTFSPKYWKNISSEAKDLISKLLVTNPDKRMTAKAALSHEWITCDDEILQKQNLDINLEELKKFNAKRKLKAAVKAVIMARKLESLGDLHNLSD